MRVNTTAGLDDRGPRAWERSAHVGSDWESGPGTGLSTMSSGESGYSLIAGGGRPAISGTRLRDTGSSARTASVDVALVAHDRCCSSTSRMSCSGSCQGGEKEEDERV